MADRRMFAKTIVDSDAFLDMPLSTQALYFHLGMRADDDGFINNPRKIQRMLGCSDDDIKLLIAKRFIIPFESGVVVIKHWRMHNYIRGDRKKDTAYPEEMGKLVIKDNGAYTLISEEVPLIEEVPPVEDTEDETAREKAYSESDLPYSFSYKIRKAFYGKSCPVCGVLMKSYAEEGIVSTAHIPSIQHNIPISLGGKHELSNISVICKQCNVSIQDEPTGNLNNDEVIRVWNDIVKNVNFDSQLTTTNEKGDSVGKVSIGKDSIGKDSKERMEDRKSGYEAIIEDLSEDLKDAVREFLKMRKLIRKPMTDRGLKILLTKLNGLASDEQMQKAILEQSIEAGWTSVYPLKENGYKGDFRTQNGNPALNYQQSDGLKEAVSNLGKDFFVDLDKDGEASD